VQRRAAAHVLHIGVGRLRLQARRGRPGGHAAARPAGRGVLAASAGSTRHHAVEHARGAGQVQGRVWAGPPWVGGWVGGMEGNFFGMYFVQFSIAGSQAAGG
jgi:hypothetical protein